MDCTDRIAGRGVGGAITVGAGKLSVVGLDENTVRITIVANEGPIAHPWYKGPADFCHFDLTSFSMHLNIAVEQSDPFAVVIGYEASGTGFTLENGSIIFGQANTAQFTGGFKQGSATAIPFDFALDFSSDPATIEGSFGGVPASCTIDLATFRRVVLTLRAVLGGFRRK